MLKRSKQKEAIVNLLSRTTSHPTVEAIYIELKKVIPSISLATVYRNLRILCLQGKVSQLDLYGGLSRFDAITSEHYHFRCEVCGSIYDIDEPFDVSLNARVQKKTGFKVKSHYLEFRGMCSDCACEI